MYSARRSALRLFLQVPHFRLNEAGHTESVRARLILLALLIFGGALPANAAAPADGTLEVQDGKGRVELSVRGAIIGRIERGKITVTDPNPRDARRPVVLGAERRKTSRNGKTTVYSGRDIRVRSTGAFVRVLFSGKNIQVSAVGRGRGLIQGSADPFLTNADGVWSLNDEPYQSLPETLTGFQLVGPPDNR